MRFLPFQQPRPIGLTLLCVTSACGNERNKAVSSTTTYFPIACSSKLLFVYSLLSWKFAIGKLNNDVTMSWNP